MTAKHNHYERGTSSFVILYRNLYKECRLWVSEYKDREELQNSVQLSQQLSGTKPISLGGGGGIVPDFMHYFSDCVFIENISVL